MNTCARIGYGVGALTTGFVSLLATAHSFHRSRIDQECSNFFGFDVAVITGPQEVVFNKTREEVLVENMALGISCSLPPYAWGAIAITATTATVFLTYRAFCCGSNPKFKNT